MSSCREWHWHWSRDESVDGKEQMWRCRARESYIEDVSRVVNEPAMAATNGSEALKYRGLIVYGWVSTEVEALRCGGSYPIPNGRHHGM
jgi:hypothetical protein